MSPERFSVKLKAPLFHSIQGSGFPQADDLAHGTPFRSSKTAFSWVTSKFSACGLAMQANKARPKRAGTDPGRQRRT